MTSLRVRPRLVARDLALIAVFAALIAAMGVPGKVPVPGLAVPITLQTLGVMLAGCILGARRGALAVLTFLALTAAGLPLLAGGRGGFAVFTGPSGGFLLGWIAGAFVIGALVERRPARAELGWLAASNVVGGIGVVYLFGVPFMAWASHLSVTKALTASAAFLPGDAVKVAIATAVTAGVLRGYPPAMPPRRRERAKAAAAAEH